jgi:hypothetical protein
MEVSLGRGWVPSGRLEVPPELDRPFDQALWARLEAMEIDPPDATTWFHHRLKQYNKWSDEFAERVTKEYLRFLYLAARAGHPVTPSDRVDQAWHLHLIYTRHYWEELCGNILGLQLHHEPSVGGALESRKFERQYQQTIESYQAAFGETPPVDIWPVRKPGKLGTHGKKFLVAGATVVGMAIAFAMANIPLAVFVGFAGIIAYSRDAAGSGGYAASVDASGSCGSSGGGCGGGGCGGCGG